MQFGGLNYWDRDNLCNVVYIKGKDKLVYWSTLDGEGRGAVYKELPTGARSSENPKALFQEEFVIDGQFPGSGRGAELLEEFIEYVQATGADELRESAVFNATDVKRLKPVRDRVNTKP